MSRVLDRDRPFAEVFGVSNVRYEQDGLCFDYSGKLISEDHPDDLQIDDLKAEPRKRGRPRKAE